MRLPSIKRLPFFLILIGLIAVCVTSCSSEPVPTAVSPTTPPPPTEEPRPTDTPEPLPEVTQWGVFDEAVQIPGDYTNEQKYREIEVTAQFVGPDGREVDVNGFWDGDSTWRIRFAPNLPGDWAYTIQAVDEQGEIATSNGRFHAIPPTADLLDENPNFRGFLQLSENGRYLTYADGTPFFWMGDTAWRANRLTMSLVPDPDDDGPDVAEFPTYLDNRQAKGFSVIQVVAGFPTQPERINEGGPTYLEMFSVINPANFQWLDRRLEAILDRAWCPSSSGSGSWLWAR
jgi:hypothetical protein